LARKEVTYLLRSRATLVWTFVMPVIFFYFIGTITGGFSVGPAARESISLRVPPDAGFLVEQLARRLEDRQYQVLRPPEEQFARAARRLVIPAGFTDSVLAGKPVQIDFSRAGGGLGSDYDEIRVARAVYSLLADVIVAGEEGGAVAPESFARLAARPRALSVKVERAGARKKIPTGFEQAVPGTMVMFTLLVLFTSGGVWLVIERNQGLLRRLASAPVSRGSVVLAKWGARMVLGLIQISFAMLTGTLLFGVDWGSHLLALWGVLAAYGALAAALGILLGNFARSEGQVIALGVISTNVLAALGGCWWPIEITPDWAQKLALFLPTGWAMDALHKLVSFGDSSASVLPHLAGMTIAALLAGALAARSFRFQ